jgi:hypothetical protein
MYCIHVSIKVIVLLLLAADKISQQPENCENRNDPDLVQAFLKKWWVESDFKAPNIPLSLRLITVKETQADICNLIHFDTFYKSRPYQFVNLTYTKDIYLMVSSVL